MPSKRKVRLGQVVSDSMDKTVVVAVETPRIHPLYKKTIRRMVKYKAHDDKNECQVGDKVKIVETRPLSRDKRWRVAEIITKGEVVEISPQEITEAEIAEIRAEVKPEAEVVEAEAEEKPEEEVAKAEAEEKPEEEVAKAKPKAKTKKKTTEEVAE